MGIELVTIHLTTLLCTAVFIIAADHEGIQYMRGAKKVLDSKLVRFLHYAVLLGLTGMIITGGLMFLDAWGELIYYPAFYVKMLMVLALVANSVVIGKLMHIATQTPFAELTQSQQRMLVTSGAVSGFCWVGAATIGLFFL